MNQIAAIGHNLREPLDIGIEIALKEFRSQYDDRGPDIEGCKVTNDDEAGRATALAGLLADLWETADARRTEIKAPYLKAERQIDRSFGTFLQIVKAAKTNVLGKIDAYRKERQRIADEEAAKAAQEAAKKEAAARAAAESGNLAKAALLEREAERAAALVQQAAVPETIRSAYGQSAHARTEWKFHVLDRNKLPKSITAHPKVLEAQDAVIKALVRSGTRELPGVKIFPEITTVVRR